MSSATTTTSSGGGGGGGKPIAWFRLPSLRPANNKEPDRCVVETTKKFFMAGEMLMGRIRELDAGGVGKLRVSVVGTAETMYSSGEFSLQDTFEMFRTAITIQLGTGQSAASFAVPLPLNAPASFLYTNDTRVPEVYQGRVWYSVLVQDHEDEETVLFSGEAFVAGARALPDAAYAGEQRAKGQPVSSLPLVGGTGGVRMRFELKKAGYCLGEPVPVVLRVINASSKPLAVARLLLKKRTTIAVSKNYKLEHEETLDVKEYPLDIDAESQAAKEVHYSIPPLAGAISIELFSIQVALRLVAEVGSVYSEIPVWIAPIPVVAAEGAGAFQAPLGIKVHVQEGRNMKPAYTTVDVKLSSKKNRFEGFSQTTLMADKVPDPFWDSHATFQLCQRQKQFLRFDVQEKRLLSSSDIGYVQLRVAELFPAPRKPGQRVEGWYPLLKGKKDPEEVGGEIHLVIELAAATRFRESSVTFKPNKSAKAAADAAAADAATGASSPNVGDNSDEE